MAVLDRSDLEASSLADLHSIAGQIGLDGFRRLRKAELIEMILGRSGDDGKSPASGQDTDEATGESSVSRRRRGGRRGRSADADSSEADGKSEQDDADAEDAQPAVQPARRASSRRGSGRSRASVRARTVEAGEEDADAEDDQPAAEREQAIAEGEVEVLGNGSAFLRVSPPDSSDDDVYISAAQVRRCELVNGDRVSGPVRKPRRSERYASLARIDTINGEPADSGTRAVKYDTLPARFPSEPFKLGGDDPTVAEIAQHAPIGYGSRVCIVGAARSGKTEALRRLLAVLAGVDGLACTLLLLSGRPEEAHEWEQGPIAPAASLTFAASADAQGQALEQAVDTAKRLASRGEHALVAIDSLDGVHPHVARRALAAAKSIDGAGSLTIIATASRPFGGESTVIALDAAKASTGRLPAVDLLQSGTLRPELLVGEDAAQRILSSRAELASAR